MPLHSRHPVSQYAQVPGLNILVQSPSWWKLVFFSKRKKKFKWTKTIYQKSLKWSLRGSFNLDACRETSGIRKGKPYAPKSSELPLKLPSDHVVHPLRPVSSSKCPELVQHYRCYNTETTGLYGNSQYSAVCLTHRERASTGKNSCPLRDRTTLQTWLITGCGTCTLLSPLLLVWGVSKPPRWLYLLVFSLSGDISRCLISFEAAQQRMASWHSRVW